MVVQTPSRLMGRAERLALRRLRNPSSLDQIMADEAVASLSTAGDVLWPLADYQGTIRDLATYDSGLNQTSIANHLVYDSFGKLTSQTNSSVDHLFGFTGAQRDEESGLQYHRARYYDPDTGRWLSEDPSGFTAGDPNLARMVSNNPVNLTDPSGLQQQSGSGLGSTRIDESEGCFLPVRPESEEKSIIEQMKDYELAEMMRRIRKLEEYFKLERALQKRAFERKMDDFDQRQFQEEQKNRRRREQEDVDEAVRNSGSNIEKSLPGDLEGILKGRRHPTPMTPKPKVPNMFLPWNERNRGSLGLLGWLDDPYSM